MARVFYNNHSCRLFALNIKSGAYERELPLVAEKQAMKTFEGAER
jgi:hypothetical protein